MIALVDPGAEMATASAWHPASAAAGDSALRLWLSRRVSTVYKRLLGRDVYTFTCLFRAYRADALRRIALRSSGFAAVAEIMLCAIVVGYTVGEVPIRLESRRFGESKRRIGDAIAGHARLMLSTALMVGSRKARALGSRLLMVDDCATSDHASAARRRFSSTRVDNL